MNRMRFNFEESKEKVSLFFQKEFSNFKLEFHKKIKKFQRTFRSNIPSWSGQKRNFSEPAKYLSGSIFVFGSLVRIENLIPERLTFLLSSNQVFKFISFNKVSLTNVEIMYLSSIIFLISSILFSYKIPRIVKIAKRRRKHVNGLSDSINESNVEDWVNKFLASSEEYSFKSRRIYKKVLVYRGYCEANRKAGLEIEIDSGFRSVVVHAIQAEYDFTNRKSMLSMRGALWCSWWIATGLASVASLDTILKTLHVIFFNA